MKLTIIFPPFRSMIQSPKTMNNYSRELFLVFMLDGGKKKKKILKNLALVTT